MKNSHNLDLYQYEQDCYDQGYKLIAGVDEVGRGCLAGPCVVCCCILKPGYYNKEINDSKRLSDKKRRFLVDEIKANCLAYKIVEIPAEEVELNVKAAARKGMKVAIESISTKPDIALVDYEKVDTKIPTMSIVKGDEKSISIAAASILAKVYRDDLLIQLAKDYPCYDFENNKGYGTKKHLQALNEFGPIKGVHRISWIFKKEVKNE